MNISVISVKLLAPHDTAFITALLSAVVLARVPLFVFGSLQASLLRGLSEAVASRDRHAYRQLLLRTGGVHRAAGRHRRPGRGGAGAVAGAAAVRLARAAGLDGLRLAVGRHAVLHARLGAGPGAADHRWPRRQLLAWAVGTAALIGVTMSPMPIRDRVEIAYAVGAAITAGILTVRVIYVTGCNPRAIFPVKLGGRMP